MGFRLFRRSANRKLIDRLHGEIVAVARDPIFFTEYGVEDSFEGRFEMVTLHAVLVLRQLNRMAPPAPEIAQDLADAVFHSFEVGLREAGVGDISVPKRMKTIAEAFLGRGAVYDLALRAGPPDLAATLARNVYARQKDAGRLSLYVEAANQALANVSLKAFTEGEILFPRPSAIS
ncbi:ubiquinol-cytochrome c chaperone [Beijerinckiaceae bacterium]|nr:ubiquinol-cytochrome c chaperone [Beijerinckiaceae bacterium]